jgi:hypothetical protein
VFNYVNLHVYHYAGNNPVKYVDPDGRTGSFPDGSPEQNTQWEKAGELKQGSAEDIQINPPGRDPTKSPGEKWEWRGKQGSQPGDKEGSWHNPETGESLYPDLDHPDGIMPHWDYTPGKGKDKVRIDPDTGRPLLDNGDKSSSDDSSNMDNYSITYPRGLLNPDITNPDFIPQKPPVKLPLFLPVPIPGFRYRYR